MKHLLTTFTCLIFTILFTSCSNNDDTNTTPPEDVAETVTDADGNVYNTIKIGNQTWMLENLKTTKFNDGTPITEYTFETFGNNWGSLIDQIALYQWADTSDLNNVVDEEIPFDFYGAMYNHFAIESGKLAPEGWRIPSLQDFIELENYLANNGESGNEATALKSITGWLPSSGNGTNSIGFNGLPNGYINGLGGPTLGNGICSWATSTVENGEINSSLKRKWVQLFDEPTILYTDTSITLGAAIRCIKIED